MNQNVSDAPQSNINLLSRRGAEATDGIVSQIAAKLGTESQLHLAQAAPDWLTRLPRLPRNEIMHSARVAKPYLSCQRGNEIADCPIL
ncbi:unnamed protein product [Leptosia nina]|uniref:Uncharacterized protein n=1 Tax=Leptosia nina TaxID=320188 RepID=A0AAV1J2H3_9NEOP